MNFFKIFLLTASLAPAAYAAAAENRVFNLGDGAYSPDSYAPPAPEAAAPAGGARTNIAGLMLPMPQKKWTILLFLNGRNDLQMPLLFKVAALEKLGSDGDINIIIEAGAIEPIKEQFGQTWNGARRFYVQKASGDTAGWKISASAVLGTKPNADMGDYRNLAEFINWSKANFPAEKYLIAIANHGAAWFDKKKTTAPKGAKGVSYDDVSGNYITTRELGTALREAGGTDILLFDDCLMQTIEVASEIKDSVKFIIGSEEEGRAGTFHYDTLLAPLKKNPAMSARELTMNIMRILPSDVRARLGMLPHTVSALDASKLAGLNILIKDFAAAALELEGKDGPAFIALREAMNEVLRYDYPFCADLYDFVNLAQESVKAKITEGRMTESEKTRAFDRSAESLKTYMAGQLVLSNFTQGASHGGRSLSESRGISIYVPDIWTYFTHDGIRSSIGTGITSYSLETKYPDLEFDRSTGWSKFAGYLVKGRPK